MKRTRNIGKKRIVVICPGRGSYGKNDLSYLSRPLSAESKKTLQSGLTASDRRRHTSGKTPLLELDRSDKLTAAHSSGENISPLTFVCTASDYLRIDTNISRIIAVIGNSMGWYTALYCAGSLTLDEGILLTETMGGITGGTPIGGQILYPITDDCWMINSDLMETVDNAIAKAQANGYQVGNSIYYGGYRVIWGDDEGLLALKNLLPAYESGGRTYPLHLDGHSAFHSPLLAEYATRGTEALSNAINWQKPEIPIIDGCGRQWSPLSTSIRELSQYTLHTQVTETFDFTSCVKVALREFSPDLLVCLGPGDLLGAPVGQIVIQEKWQAVKDRSDFISRQKINPIVLSFARENQRRLITQKQK